MKRNRFFLTVTALLPLLCICIQSWWTVETVMEAEDNIPEQVVMVPNQLPLEDERHYAEDAMQYAISVGSITTKLTKWNGECIETSAALIICTLAIVVLSIASIVYETIGNYSFGM